MIHGCSHPTQTARPTTFCRVTTDRPVFDISQRDFKIISLIETYVLLVLQEGYLVKGIIQINGRTEYLFIKVDYSTKLKFPSACEIYFN